MSQEETTSRSSKDIPAWLRSKEILCAMDVTDDNVRKIILPGLGKENTSSTKGREPCYRWQRKHRFVRLCDSRVEIRRIVHRRCIGPIPFGSVVENSCNGHEVCLNPAHLVLRAAKRAHKTKATGKKSSVMNKGILVLRYFVNKKMDSEENQMEK